MAVLQFASVKVCATMAAVYSRAVGEAWNGRIEQGDNIVIHDFYILGGLLGGGVSNKSKVILRQEEIDGQKQLILCLNMKLIMVLAMTI